MESDDPRIAFIAIGLGVLIALFGLLADIVGYGISEGFGPGQILMVVVGVGLIGYGLMRDRQRS